MKRTLKSVSALAVAVLSLGFASCSSSDNENIVITKDYTCGFYTTVEKATASTTTPNDNRIEPWFNAKTAELNKTLGGTVTVTNEGAYEKLKKQGTDAVDALANEFKTAVEKKTHDFGYYDTSDLKIIYNIKEGEKTCYSYGATLEYHHMKTMRMESSKKFTVDVNKNLNSSDTYAEDITVSLDDLGFDSKAEPEFDFASYKIYNQETYDAFKGSSFLSTVTHNESKREITFTLSYKKTRAADYPGKWYVLIPVKIDQMEVDAIVYIENK